MQDPNERSAAIHEYSGQSVNGDRPMAESGFQKFEINQVRSPLAQQTRHLTGEQPQPSMYDLLQQHGMTIDEEDQWSPEGLSSLSNGRLTLSIQTRSPTNELSLDGSAYVDSFLYTSPDADAQDQPATSGWTSDDATVLLRELERELGPLS